MTVLVTGGCGFIGSHFVRRVLARYPGRVVVNLDALTYAGKLSNLRGIPKRNYRFVRGNVRDIRLVQRLFSRHDFGAVVHFAAESHVDKSILGPRIFVETNVEGTQCLLDAALAHWKKKGNLKKARFVQVSTDEVYGSLPEKERKLKFTEESPIEPSSPYSASKAAADLMALAYRTTFGLPVLITRCSNNYGPFQDTEKLIPLMIRQALKNRKLPVYGDGRNVRDWIYVEDHCAAVDKVWHKGRVGEVYNIGASNEKRNLEIVHTVLRLLKRPKNLIQFVPDRLGHDRRYAIDSSKIQKELGWTPGFSFGEALKKTVEWYKRELRVKSYK